LNNRASLKTFDSLCKDGSFGKVASSFWSCDIWTTYYTGLSPANHGVQYIRLSNPLSKNVYSPSSPLCLWNVINKQNLSFGMIEGLVTYPAPKVNGFFWSGKPWSGDDYIYPESLRQFVSKDYPAPLLPPPISHYGITDSFENAPLEKLQEILTNNYYAEFAPYLAAKLAWYREKMDALLNQYKVDVLYYYSLDLDLFGHFTQHPSCLQTQINTYQVLDNFMGSIIADYQPDMVLFVSDHGMQPTARAFDPYDVSCCLKGDYEWCVRVLPDRTFVHPWTNQSIATGIHSNTGFYAFSGQNIKKDFNLDIDFLQIYPVILQALGLTIPSHPEGVPPQIFI